MEKDFYNKKNDETENEEAEKELNLNRKIKRWFKKIEVYVPKKMKN